MDQFLSFLNITPKEAYGILIGAPIFFVFWKVIDSLVIRHFLALFEEREASTEGAHSASEEILRKANAIEMTVDGKIQQVRAHSQAERLVEIQAAREAADTLIQGAEKEAAAHVHENRRLLDIEQKKLQEALPQKAKTFAVQLAARLKDQSTSLHGIASFFAVTAIFSLTFAENVLAASTHGGGHHGAGGIETLFPYAVNFSIYVALMIYLLRKPVINGWHARRDAIEDKVQKGKKEADAAQAILAAAIHRQDSLQNEIDRVKYEIRQGTQTETRDILKDASDRAFRIREQGKSLAEGDTNHQREDYKKQLSTLVVNEARVILKSEITAQIDESIRRNALKKVESKLEQVVIQ